MSTRLLVRNIVVANRIIYVLTFTTLLSIVTILAFEGFFTASISPDFRNPVRNADAKDYIDKHRGSLVFRKQTKVIVYDPDTIKKYLNETFPEIILRHPINQAIYPPGQYKWMVGFYPMHRYDDNGKRRLDFLVVPTYCSIDYRQLIDFRDSVLVSRESDSVVIAKRSNRTGPCKDCDGYDAGHIWP